MGTNALTSRVDGNKIPANDHNELVQAFLIDIVPRNNSRVAQDIIGSLGTSALRWLRTYSKEYFMGNAANNLRIYEGAANEIWIERGSSSNELIKLKNGSVEILVGGVVKALINSTGIVPTTSFSDSSIPTSKIELKPLTTQAPINFNSFPVADIFSFAKTLKINKNYIVNLDWGGQNGTSTATRIEINIAAVDLRVFDGTTGISGIGSVAFMFTASASASTNFFIRGKGNFTNISCQVVEL